jgi:hypothetical protein
MRVVNRLGPCYQKRFNERWRPNTADTLDPSFTHVSSLRVPTAAIPVIPLEPARRWLKCPDRMRYKS